jgi:hypothetical protein
MKRATVFLALTFSLINTFAQMTYGGRVSVKQFNLTFYGGMAGFLILVYGIYNYEAIATYLSKKIPFLSKFDKNKSKNL